MCRLILMGKIFYTILLTLGCTLFKKLIEILIKRPFWVKFWPPSKFHASPKLILEVYLGHYFKDLKPTLMAIAVNSIGGVANFSLAHSRQNLFLRMNHRQTDDAMSFSHPFETLWDIRGYSDYLFNWNNNLCGLITELKGQFSKNLSF